ncbi:OmpA family protein [Mucilaginibacter sp. SMC90]|uniref:OmpA family protein n=1 Tax=Mucilaginibacter sp. SMC90 TaxID=2929803 RepID=UPI001FB499D9|nr:OmpA family protein [Mucilaginibacter sp. SMC90]UOE47336.1 OmpA family protein [Mucilaginibacter sp. SMC90]
MIKFYLTTVILSLAYLGTAYAQNISDSTKTTATTTSSETQTAKVFGGLGQYRKFSIGINGGVTSQSLATGGSTDFQKKKISLGYGISLKEQLAHSFALQLDLNGGKIKGENPISSAGTYRDNYVSYDTKFWQASLSAVVNVATIDFIRRKNAVNFYFKAGGGLAIYDPTIVRNNGSGDGTAHFKNDGTDGTHYVKELVIPVGAGVKFRLSDAVALDLGYTQNHVDGDNFDGFNRAYPTKDHYSYGYAGLAFTLGSKSKPVLEWANPVATMYDELYDAALREEVEALKVRIANVETAVNDLKKDFDGDGVADQFDKCPGTAAGSVVDGSGCPFVLIHADTIQASTGTVAYANIQFGFKSSILTTSSYPTLDASAADLRASGKIIEIDGFASKDEGTTAYKMKLSNDRANSVKVYLVNSGVAPQKIKIKSYGETKPIADNSTQEGRVLNRRVQFILIAASSPFPTRITFDPNQSVLKADMKSKLKVIVAYLTANPGAQIDLKGHCNAQEIPRTELNNDHNAPIKLSQARINSVFNYLISQHVTAVQIKSKIALGTASPLSGVNNYDRQFQNRSVEITEKSNNTPLIDIDL